MSTQHTPGEWLAIHDLDGDYAIFAGDKLIAVTDKDTDEDQANAVLIAAAPELLKELEHARVYIVGLAGYLETCSIEVIADNLPTTVAYLKDRKEIIATAIKKARGQS
jgi:hypothetical protein